MEKAPLAFKVSKEITVPGNGRSFIMPLDRRWLYFMESHDGKLLLVGGSTLENGTRDDTIDGIAPLEELLDRCKETETFGKDRISSLSKDITDLEDKNSAISVAMKESNFPMARAEIVIQLRERIKTYQGFIKFAKDIRWDIEIILDRYKTKEEAVPNSVKKQTDKLFSTMFTGQNSVALKPELERQDKTILASLTSLFKRNNTDEPKPDVAKSPGFFGKSKD